MFHSIATILTTTAVTLHALLGCCAHHSHACEDHHGSVEVAVDEHHHHGQEAHNTSDHSVTDPHEHQQDDGHQDHHGSCDKPDCSFVLNQTGQDVTQILTQSMSLPVLGDAVCETSMDSSTSSKAGTESRSDCLLLPQRLRALSQVWRL